MSRRAPGSEGSPKGASPPRFSRWCLRAVARPADRDAVALDLDDEFEQMIDEGASPTEARAWYRRQVWGSMLPLLGSRIRGVASALGPNAGWGLDLKLALRMLVKHPGLTLVAVFALAIGIPVGLAPTHAASIFSTPPPLPDAERLFVVRNWDRPANDWARSTLLDYDLWSGRLATFEALGAAHRRGFNLRFGVSFATDDASTEAGFTSFEGAEVTASALAMLRVRPFLGRLPDPDDERAGATEVVVVSHDLWTTRLLGDSSAVGSRRIEVGGVPHTVIGVMPEGFGFPYQARLWVPRRRAATERDDGADWIVFGRLAEGVTPARAEAEAVGVGAAVDVDEPAGAAELLRPAVVPFTDGLFGLGRDGLKAERGFFLIQALALFVLLVACVNIGMLMLVRTLSRSREIAVRTALGASRGRVIGQLFVEALVLALIAAGIGLVLADQAASRLDFMQRLLPYWFDLGIRPSTVGWALVLAVLSAAVVGVVPAFKITGRQVRRSIQNASAARTGVRFGGVSSLLIVADVSLAVVAVGIAFGMSDDLRAVAGGDATIAADEYLTATVAVQAPARLGAREEELVSRLSEAPGVRAVAVADRLPGMGGRNQRFEVRGEEELTGRDARRSGIVRVRPGFFAALDQPVQSGRSISALDRSSGAQAVVVNRPFATEFFAGRDPLGQFIRAAAVDATAEAGVEPWLEIVGVVGDLRRSSRERREGPIVYATLPPESLARVAVAVRTADDPAAFVSTLRHVVHEVEPTAVVGEPTVLAEVESFDDSILRWFVLGVQSMIAILIGMAASGTYALLSYTVTERTHEIAVRSALGSPRSAVLMAIGRRALMQIGGGVALGMAATAGFYYVETQGGWVPPVSPALLVLSAGLAVGLTVGALAFVGPTRRGLRIDPARALQT